METILKVQKQFATDLSMFYEKNRLETFKTWPFGQDKACSAIKMAEAGFVCTGNSKEPDAECFLCKKSLDGWEETDDPWEEHLKHSKSCKFVQIRKPEICLTPGEIIELKKYMINKQFEIHITEAGEAYNKAESVKINNIKNILMAKKR